MKNKRLMVGLICFSILLISTIIYKCSDNNKNMNSVYSIESRIYDEDINKKELQKVLKLIGDK
jgi:hypothetical protein